MPIYEYRCNNGHNFEVVQSMTDEPVTTCEQCKGPVERVFHPIAVHFKGSGFYTTDYARKGAEKADADGGSEKAETEKKDKKDKASDSKASDSKPKDSKAKTGSSKSE